MKFNPKEVPKCPLCNGQLMFTSSGYKSEEGSTEVYSELNGYCLNPKCKIYAGRKEGEDVVINSNSPIAETVRNKVN